MRARMASSCLRFRAPAYFAGHHVLRDGRDGKMCNFTSGRRMPSEQAIARACDADRNRRRAIRRRNGEARCAAYRTASRRAADLAADWRRISTSPFHLQRTFKSVLGISPKAYADACRLNQLKHNLQAGHSVTRAMYDAGYSSSSRLYERTASQLGMTPDKYRRGAMRLRSAIRWRLSAGTDVDCGDGEGNLRDPVRRSDDELEYGLKHEFPFALRQRDDAKLRDMERQPAAPDARPEAQRGSAA